MSISPLQNNAWVRFEPRETGTKLREPNSERAGRLCVGFGGAAGQGSRLVDKPLKHPGHQHLIYWLWSVSALT